MTPDEKLKCEIGEIILELFNFPMATFSIERTYEKEGEQSIINLGAVLGSAPCSEGGPAVAFDPLRVKDMLKACLRSTQMSEWKLTEGPHLEMEEYRQMYGEKDYQEYMTQE